MKIQEIEFSRLIPADYNPRVALTPDMPEFERLKNSIETFGNAIIIAREKGFVTFSDVMESINKYFDFPWVGACGYNTGSNKARALLYDTTMAQWLRSNWNDTKKGTSPARAYGGVLVPDGKDENGDVIYRYAIKR